MLVTVWQTTVLTAFLLFGSLANSLPLSTSGRWVVDAASGSRTKLRCVNWVAHMQPMLAEGLDKKPLRDIVDQVSSLGFNCVRLTWATFMFTRTHYGNLTVSRSLERLGLSKAAIGVAKNNPSLVNLTLVEAYNAVVDEIGVNGRLMVVLDNHVSRPKWCCGSDDGNGFFGDRHFDPKEWLSGLSTVATQFHDKPQVVGMSMRNELRGPRQNTQDWYRYIQQGATTIHKANPSVLIIVSGLSYDTDLSFLTKKPLRMNFDKNLVYEVHWYSFSDRKRRDWEVQQQSQVCANSIQRFNDRAGFLVEGESPVPLFVSEFGVDQRGVKRADNRFLSCFLAYMAEKDLDWAMWALQGSYYLRNERAGFEETYGVLDSNWDLPKNQKFQERFRLILNTIQDPTSEASTYHIMYHPLSGRCVCVDENNSTVHASDCVNRSQWNYTGDGSAIRLMGTSLCLAAVGDELPVSLTTDCSSNQSTWRVDSSSKMRVNGTDAKGRSLCIEHNPSNSSEILTKDCLCSNDDSVCDENPQTQWFKLIKTNLKM